MTACSIILVGAHLHYAIQTMAASWPIFFLSIVSSKRALTVEITLALQRKLENWFIVELKAKRTLPNNWISLVPPFLSCDLHPFRSRSLHLTFELLQKITTTDKVMQQYKVHNVYIDEAGFTIIASKPNNCK